MPFPISIASLGLAFMLSAFSVACAGEASSNAHAQSRAPVRIAQAGNDADARSAFEAAKELGTVEAWDAFLSNYPSGFYADLARAYLKKASGDDGGSSQKEERRVAFSCNEGIPLIVTFVEEPNESYALYSQDSGPTIRLSSARTGSGFLYSDGYHELRGKGDEISLIEGGNTIDTCKAE